MSARTHDPLIAAEKTIGILKDRVRSLYDQGPQTAIHRQLDRGREREEAARQKRAIMAAKNEELQRYSAELEGVVAKRTAELRAILDNVTFGFVVVNESAAVQPGFTLSCQALFGREIREGDDLTELFGVAGTSSESMIKMGLTQVFDDFMPTEVTVEQIPSQFTAGETRLRAEYRAIRTDNGQVSSVLITVSDITSLWNAEREAERNHALIQILQQKRSFATFVADSRNRLAVCQQSLEDQAYVRRAVHTVKGNSASYGLIEVAQTAHDIEAHAELSSEDLGVLMDSLNGFIEENKAVLGADLADGGGSVEVNSNDLEHLREILDPLDVEAIEIWGQRMLQQPARELMGPMNTLVERIAERLDRRVAFRVEGAETAMDPQVMQPVLSTLSHLLRNAVDHGLEPEHERGDKDPVGQLVTRFGSTDQHWFVEVEDDGRGVDVARVVEKAVLRGDITRAQASELTLEEKLNLLFLDGLSSREEATDLSGRGVGMSAVREVVDLRGGTIQITTGAGGTMFRLEIPMNATAGSAPVACHG